MRRANLTAYLLIMLLAAVTLSTAVHAQTQLGPGTLPPPTSDVSDQKAGSVLVFSIYSSGATSGNVQNTRFSLTNTSVRSAAYVQLIFVDATTGLSNSSYICFTRYQTATFLASDIDPGVTGYLIAITVDNETGCPISHNFMTGMASVKFPSGHAASYGAETFSALYSGLLNGCGNLSVTARIAFDGVSYNRAPRALALDKVRSNNDGYSTLLVVSRLDGDLINGISGLGTLFGALFDDAGTSYPFSAPGPTPQFRTMLSNNFPATSPPFTSAIPGGRSGWLKIFSSEDVGIVGVAIQFNANAGLDRTAFSGGQNLDKLTLTDKSALIMRVFPPSC
jgi:hypothetical protein